MKNYTCPTCSKTTEIPHTKLQPVSFSCPFCLSVANINNGFLTNIGRFKNEIDNNYTFIGEKIIFESKTYHVVGISTKKDTATQIKWNEYIVVDYDGNLFYLSHGSDFNSYLKEFPFEKIEYAVNKGLDLKYKTNNYKYDFSQNAVTDSAQGIFFNDITTSVFLRTYYDDFDDTKFISVEKYNDKTEAFEGNYIKSPAFKSLFSKQREEKYLKNNVIKNIALFFAIVSFIMGILHFALNYNNVNSYNYSAYIEKNQHITEIVTNSFKITENDQKLKLDFISEVEKQNINVAVSLVNEKTNEHLRGGNFIHFFNSSNQASGNQITFCHLNKGDYHLVFTYNEIGTESNQKYTIDYKITVGGVTQIWLYLFILLCFIVGFIYFGNIVNKSKIRETQTFTDLLNYNNKRIIYVGIGIIAFYTIFNFLLVSNYNCNSNIKNKQLENTTYTGSRSHYTYRTYSSSGSHK